MRYGWADERMVVALAQQSRVAKRPRRLGVEGPGDIPAEVNAFVGRERELTRLRELQSSTRLLTLVGPGGVGKTRLALRLAAEVSQTYMDGVLLVDLSSVSDPSLVPQAFGDVLGLRESGESWIVELTRVVRRRQLLLVVDNCEHLADACAALTDSLLRSCVTLSLLATSRQPLGVTGEMTWRVPPLSVPSRSETEIEQLAGSEAVLLFVARVKAHLPAFCLTPQNADAVAAICRRLDGLPLALELAAARVESLGLAEIATRLATGFEVVGGSARTVPARQRTLRATLDWSWSLLEPSERAVLRRVSAFAGGWTLAAAVALCGGVDELHDAVVIDTVAQLVTKSLVVADHIGTTVRYRLLETVRSYAQEQLVAAGETAKVQREHAAYMLRLAESSPPQSIDHVKAALLMPEEDNVRVGLSWAINQRDAEIGTRLANAAYPMWMFSGHYSEGANWFERLLALPTASGAGSRAQVLALGYCGQLRILLGDYDVAQEHGNAALEQARSLEDEVTVALILEMLGNIALQRGDLEKAEALHAESAQRKRELESPRLVSNLLQLGLMAIERRDFDRVRQLVAEVETFARVLNGPLLTAGALHLRGLVAASDGATTTAVRLFEQALELRRPAADQQGVVKTLTSLGHAQLDRGQSTRAIDAFAEAVRIAGASGERVRVIRALEGLARCMVVTNAEGAVRVFAAAHVEREALGTVPWPTEQARLDQCIKLARRALGEHAFHEAWEDGKVSTLTQAVSLAEALTVESAVANNSPKEVLSAREREVAVRLARGWTNKQIAGDLTVSPGTVRSHVEHILVKLDLRSRAQVAVWATQQGLLDNPS